MFHTFSHANSRSFENLRTNKLQLHRSTVPLGSHAHAEVEDNATGSFDTLGLGLQIRPMVLEG